MFFLSLLIGVSSVVFVAGVNPVHGVLTLVVVGLSFAGVLLGEALEFPALIVVLVYVGAVTVLFIFVVMMVNLRGSPTSYVTAESTLLWVLLAGALAATTVVPTGGELLPVRGVPLEQTSNLAQLGFLLYGTERVYGVFLVGGVLFVAMVAAICLSLVGGENYRTQEFYTQIRRPNAVFTLTAGVLVVPTELVEVLCVTLGVLLPGVVILALPGWIRWLDNPPPADRPAWVVFNPYPLVLCLGWSLWEGDPAYRVPVGLYAYGVVYLREYLHEWIRTYFRPGSIEPREAPLLILWVALVFPLSFWLAGLNFEHAATVNQPGLVVFLFFFTLGGTYLMTHLFLFFFGPPGAPAEEEYLTSGPGPEVFRLARRNYKEIMAVGATTAAAAASYKIQQDNVRIERDKHGLEVEKQKLEVEKHQLERDRFQLEARKYDDSQLSPHRGGRGGWFSRDNLMTSPADGVYWGSSDLVVYFGGENFLFLVLVVVVFLFCRWVRTSSNGQ